MNKVGASRIGIVEAVRWYLFISLIFDKCPDVVITSRTPLWCWKWHEGVNLGSIHIWRQMFSGIFDLPTYHHQILYYISLFSKIRWGLTYLPTQTSDVIYECSPKLWRNSNLRHWLDLAHSFGLISWWHLKAWFSTKCIVQTHNFIFYELLDWHYFRHFQTNMKAVDLVYPCSIFMNCIHT